MTEPTNAAQDYLLEAERRFLAGDLQGSEQIYEAIAYSGDTDNLRSAGYYGCGLVKFKQGAIKDAEQCFRQAHNFDADNSNACYYLGAVSQQLGDLNAAKRWFGAALAANPDHQGALDELAAIRTGEGEVQGAVPSAPIQAAPVVIPQAAPVVIPNLPGGHSPQAQQPTQQPDNRDRAPMPTRPGAIVGMANHVRQQPVPWRGKPASMVQLTFRVERYSENGEPTGNSVAVELRSHEINGTIEDGDWVELPPDFNPRKGRPIKEFLNRTTGTRIYSKYRIFNAR